MGAYCKVLGCKNHERKSGKHFFKFPKNIKRKIWIEFTKRVDWEPLPSAGICQEHFEDKYLILKKKRLYLTRDAVPTIYIESTDNGLVKTVVPFEGNFDEIENSCNNLEDDLEYVTVKKQLPDLKTICRFCAEPKSILVEIKHFESYNISIKDFLDMLKLNITCNNDQLSNLICEECFNQVLSIDAFIVKCKNAEQKISSELENTVDYITPELKVDQQYSTDKNEIIQYEETDYLIQDEVEVEQLPDDFTEDDYQTENVDNFSSGDISEHLAAIENAEQESLPNANSNSGFIKDPNGTRTILRIYECVFCKKKFGGRKTYRAHVCSITEIKCNECNKVFNRGKNYRAHLARAHRSMRFEKHYCPICKIVIFGTTTKFILHRRKCNQQRTDPIECELCKKVLPTITGYTVHKLFHTSEKIERVKTESKGSLGSSEKLCELCGKNFKTTTGHRMHMLTVHATSNEVFQCHICNKVCNNKPALSDHMRNSHKVEESPCNICGKIFRTKVLLKKHQMYHDESKRTWKCSMCAEKPGYFTKTSLKRHQLSHHGDRPRPFNCQFCGVAYGSSWQLKQHVNNKHAGETEIT